MGAKNSKPPASRTQSFRRSKREKKELLAKVEADIARIKREIDNGERVNFELLRSQLLINAGKVQEVRADGKSGKNGKEDAGAKILLDINNYIILLEQKEKERDDCRESNLDLGAVESHSFISQDVSRVLERKDRPEQDRIKSLTQISKKINELDSEIRASVANNDVRNLIIVEKKLNILYNDLDQINPTPRTNEFQEKERLVSLLIKFNKKINNVKRKSGVSDGNDGLVYSKPPTVTEQNGVLEVIQIIDELGDLEVNAFTFENVRDSPEYTKLEFKLKKHYTTLENVITTNEDERRRTLTGKNLIKKILASLKQKAIENENLITRQLLDIEMIEKSIYDYRAQAENISSADSIKLHQLDQNIRSAWDKLNLINSTFPQVKQKKENTIIEIQDLLQRMHDRTSDFQRKESRRKQLKDLKSSIVSLKRSETIRNDEESRAMLEEIEKSLRTFLSTRRSDFMKLKKMSVSSEIMDQLVTEITKENLVKVEPSQDLRRIEDVKITPPFNPGEEAIKRIQIIEKDINDIRNSIRNFKGTTESDMYDGIEEKLLRHKNELESIEPVNRIIGMAKDRSLKKIEETNITLRNKAEVYDVQIEQIRRSSNNMNRRSVKSINANLQNIMSIDSSVHAIEKQVKKFNENTNSREYASIVEELKRNENALQQIEVYDSLVSSKQDVLNHINRLQMEIATKASENENKEEDELLKIKEILRRLKQTKKKIECFSGTYKSVQYNQLEEDLKNNLADTLGVKEVNPKIIKAKLQTKETIEKYLRILDERSVKPQVVNPMAGLEKAGVNLLDIKNRMEYFAGTIHDDQYFQIIRDLHDCNDEIKTLTDEGEAGARKTQYLQYIQELFNYFDAKMNVKPSQQQAIYLNASDIKSQEVLQKLEIYSQEAELIKKEIDAYTSNSPASHYHTLDQKLIDLMVKVDKLHTYQLPEIKNKRKEIMLTLNKCSEVLDEKCRPMVDSSAAPDREKILMEIDSIMEEVDMLNDNIRNFEGDKHTQQYVNLDEALIRLFLKLDSVNPSSDAIAKNSKLKALKVVKMNMKLLEEKVRNFEEEKYGLEETLV